MSVIAYESSLPRGWDAGTGFRRAGDQSSLRKGSHRMADVLSAIGFGETKSYWQVWSGAGLSPSELNGVLKRLIDRGLVEVVEGSES